MAVVKAEPKPAYLDLDNAVEVEDKLTRALDAVQAHGDRLKEKTEAGEVPYFYSDAVLRIHHAFLDCKSS